MRTRQQINNDIREDNRASQPHDLEADVLARILEVLLDIRDLLSEERSHHG
jgi:hypothetical protein